MRRNAFAMRIKKGFEAEYERRHDEIWLELKTELTKAGISDYSIYLEERTGTLFAFQKLSEGNTADMLPANPVVRRWWAFMADIMETNPDRSPAVMPLKEVFHMD